jgi:hypothetical protein
MFCYKKNFLFITLILFCIFFTLSENITASSIMGNRKIKTASDRKVVQIEQMVERSFAQNANSQDYEAIKNAILDEVKEVFPVKKGMKVKKLNFTKVEKEAIDKSTSKFPMSSKQLEEKYQKDANEKFIPAKMNEKMTVKYRLGYDEIVKVTGEYRGLNRYHNGVRIGRETVPIFDLLPEYRIRFVKEYRDLVRKNYIRDSIKKYLQDKEQYCIKIITDSIKQIAKDNEEAGYINAWHEWRSPESVADMIYKYHLVKIMKKNKELAEGQGSSSSSKVSAPVRNNQNNNVQKSNNQYDKNAVINNIAENVAGKKKGAMNEMLQALE